MKVNGTTIVLKVIYNDKNSDDKKCVGDGVNTVPNQRAIGFYLGDDTQSQLKLHAPNLPGMLEKLSTDGIVVNGIHINVQLLMGGDLKFLNSMLGWKNNASMYPCPFCICARLAKSGGWKRNSLIHVLKILNLPKFPHQMPSIRVGRKSPPPHRLGSIAPT